MHVGAFLVFCFIFYSRCQLSRMSGSSSRGNIFCEHKSIKQNSLPICIRPRQRTPATARIAKIMTCPFRHRIFSHYIGSFPWHKRHFMCYRCPCVKCYLCPCVIPLIARHQWITKVACGGAQRNPNTESQEASRKTKARVPQTTPHCSYHHRNTSRHP